MEKHTRDIYAKHTVIVIKLYKGFQAFEKHVLRTSSTDVSVPSEVAEGSVAKTLGLQCDCVSGNYIYIIYIYKIA